MYRLALSTYKKFRFKNLSLSLLFLFWGVIMTFLTALFFVNSSINSQFEMDNNVEDFRFENTISTDYLNKLNEDYHFDYIKRQIYNESDGKQTLELLSYDESQTIDKPIIIEGRSIKQPDEVMLYDSYAISQNVKLNDFINIKGKSFKVVGLFELPDYFNTNFLATNKKISSNDVIAFVDDSYFDNLEISKSIIIGRFKDSISNSDKATYSNELFMNNDLINFINRESNPTISLLSSKIKIYKLLFVLVLIILGNILAILLGLLVYSYMLKNKKDTGVLLANGFRKRDIFMWYQLFTGIVILPATFIGSLLGLLLFHFVQPTLNSNILMTDYYKVWPIYIAIVFGFLLFHIYFSIVCTAVPYICFIRKNIIDYFKSADKVITNKKSDVFFNKLPLKTRFKLKIAIKNKLIAFIVFFAIFSAFAQGIMMMIFYNLPSSSLTNLNKSINYSQIVYTKNEDFNGQYFSQKHVITGNGENTQKTQLVAIKPGDNLKLISSKDELLNNKVSKENIVVNTVLAKSLKLNIGDTLPVTLNNQTISDLKVAGISNISNDSYVYVDYDFFVEQDYIPEGFSGF